MFIGSRDPIDEGARKILGSALGYGLRAMNSVTVGLSSGDELRVNTIEKRKFSNTHLASNLNREQIFQGSLKFNQC